MGWEERGIRSMVFATFGNRDGVVVCGESGRGLRTAGKVAIGGRVSERVGRSAQWGSLR